MSNDEREFRIRPQHPPKVRQDAALATWSFAFKKIVHYARMSRSGRGATVGTPPNRSYRQRCAVRVTYSSSRVAGQWRAHGKYLARDSATRQSGRKAGFSDHSDAVDVAETLDSWQAAGDERVFKLILSPEFGERLDLPRLTREVLTQMEIDLSRKLEWCAVVHTNTEHPHVHVALRGLSGGQPLRLPRAYVQSGIRTAAEDLCTAQLGYRTELDAIAAEKREIAEQRFTSLDRTITRLAGAGDRVPAAPCPVGLTVTVPNSSAGASETERARAHHLRARLQQLQTMGLAQAQGDGLFLVRNDFAAVLKAMQRAQDRQRLLQQHGSLLSDPRLPMVVTSIRKTAALDGRVLVHGEEDSGRLYLLLEGTDARVHYVNHTAEITAAWSGGKLRPNSFVQFQRLFGDDGRPFVEVSDLGDADRLLRNRPVLRELARKAAPDGVNLWTGWLGKFNIALAASCQRNQRTPSLER